MREDYAFFDVSREMDPRASSGKILRVKSRYAESFRFLGLCRESGYIKKFYDLKHFIIFGAHLLAPMGGKFQQLSRANDGNAVD